MAGRRPVSNLVSDIRSEIGNASICLEIFFRSLGLWGLGREGFTGFTIDRKSIKPGEPLLFNIDLPLPRSSATRAVECLTYSSLFFVLKRKIVS